MSPSEERYVIKVKGASLGWTQDPRNATLRDIDINISASTLTFVVGPVASGKSTLLKSFLGETYLHSGAVCVRDSQSFAYCDQDSWILNQTIRENIIAFSDYKQDLYETVVRACQLEEDFRHLPQGDLSNVGSQGISLSGGQKARVVSVWCIADSLQLLRCFLTQRMIGTRQSNLQSKESRVD